MLLSTKAITPKKVLFFIFLSLFGKLNEARINAYFSLT
jgi:hypothetical protein